MNYHPGFEMGFNPHFPPYPVYHSNLKRPFDTVQNPYEDTNWKRRREEPDLENEEDEGLTFTIDHQFTYWNLPVKARVLLVSNLPEELNTPERIFSLFSLYGDVDRVKVIRRKVACALVEFNTATFAAIARDYLDNYIFKGQKIVVSFSRFDRIKLPEEAGFRNEGQTMDFSGPDYQSYRRFCTEELKKRNQKKITKPTNLIYIGGLEANMSPNSIMEKLVLDNQVLATDCLGFEMKTNKRNTPGKSKKMVAYVQFETVDDAMVVLAYWGIKEGLRISFTKESIEELKRTFKEKHIKTVSGNETFF
ncbi:polypyrimidine tract-binding protein 2 [Eurytemora carolleeae]|uniref:polypyrimidine tract-binding protein 2 n=1 Tax=Eurytemora carolleeae TaxID=1294199 RepID=UPI000C75E0FB|nr:polypyrimidine tract-binding protein 2 [Eurytemora carolleeae]|eukprot:XP_023337757.1 polypyrimidine tract-binding protein 2-like [Eurytemora affinis]